MKYTCITICKWRKWVCRQNQLSPYSKINLTYDAMLMLFINIEPRDIFCIYSTFYRVIYLFCMLNRLANVTTCQHLKHVATCHLKESIHNTNPWISVCWQSMNYSMCLLCRNLFFAYMCLHLFQICLPDNTAGHLLNIKPILCNNCKIAMSIYCNLCLFNV